MVRVVRMVWMMRVVGMMAVRVVPMWAVPVSLEPTAAPTNCRIT